ncbi:MAG: hypothetical protein JXL97_05695 [Bacteroidales bacterium]|nr:hypothetical protein [Bacteroidales bacterium]
MKKFLIIIFAFLFIVFVFKGVFFRLMVKYEPVNERTTYSLKDDNFKNYVDSISSESEIGISKVLKISNKITSQSLKFTKSSSGYNPNDLFYSKSSNCIGYATFYASVCNYLLEKNNLSDEWNAKCYVGYIYLFGENVHHYFKSSFFKDHDFVIVENTKTGEKKLVDPSVYDFLGVKYVKSR